MRTAMLIFIWAALQISAEKIPPAKIPSVNARVVKYALSVVGQKVGDGSCGQLAVDALATAGATRPEWTGKPVWGKPAKPSEIVPGDIVEFRKLVVKENGSPRKWGSPDHTAIVIEVLGMKSYRIAHQNASDPSKVMIADLDLTGEVVSGEYAIYHPIVAERIYNPGFEANDKYYGWEMDQGYRTRTTNAHTGKQAAWIGPGKEVRQRVVAGTSGKYILSAFINAHGPGGIIGIRVNGAARNAVELASNGGYGKPYEKYDLPDIELAAGDVVEIFVSAGKDEVWADDFTLTNQ